MLFRSISSNTLDSGGKLYYNVLQEGCELMTISLRLSPDDAQLIRDYARLHGISVSEFMRRAALEKIEDELDVRAAEKAYAEYLADPATYTLDEIEKGYGLE